MMNYLKKMLIFFFIGIASLGLLGASIWEGAAAMAAGGELPENGYYIATNSFPRNTLVDVVNLENGKTLRAIVVGGIDNPGLLGLLSKEAANALGLEKGMVGRIRVNMPADPIAFSRYRDELSKESDPDRDPAATVALTKTEEAETAMQPPASVQEQSVAIDAILEDQNNPPSTTTADITPETEQIQELPEFQQEKSIAEAEPTPEGEPVSDVKPVTVVELSTEPSIPESSTSETPTVTQPEIVMQEMPQDSTAIAETYTIETPEKSDKEAVIAEPNIPDSSAEVAPVVTTPSAEGVELSLEPAEERPPVFMQEEKPENSKVVEVAPPKPVIGVLEQPMVTQEPVQVAPMKTTEPAPKTTFSVPTITKLDKGKYYIQLGAFTKADAVENQIKGLNKKYPLVIHIGGTTEKPIYRLLVGPLNEGESGALVSYFKKSGFKDVFVKKEG
jgi:hypothetical protein